jgi:hypothetical protein
LRHDVFFGRKSVHVKLGRDLHTSLREKLFRHGITMQDLFQEAAEMAVMDGVRSEKMLEKIAKKKLLVSLEKLESGKNSRIGELDSETMYNLLEGIDDDETAAREE